MKAVVLIPVLVLGLSWTFQGVPAEEVGTEAPPASNMFKASDACKDDVDVGPCKMEVPRYFYNSSSMACEPFTYGGCKGNQNNFESKKECLAKCSHEAVCTAEPAAGDEQQTCLALILSYFYNANTKSCEVFNYGGCGGNQNRFQTEKACLAECDPNEFCKAEPEAGPCKGNFQHYFYNATTKSCEVFTYGGCLGNQNNFHTDKLCMEKCHHEDA